MNTIKVLYSIFLAVCVYENIHCDIETPAGIKDGFLFIFHDESNLILATKKDLCYFISISDLQDNGLYSTNSSEVEDTILNLINGTSSSQIAPISLSSAESEFHDPVIGNLCSNRHLYGVTPVKSLSTSVPTMQVTSADGSTLSPPVSERPCMDSVDTIISCSSLPFICQGPTADTFCRKTCNMCGGDSTTPQTVTTSNPGINTVNPNQGSCVDIDDCKPYKPEEACCGIYQSWANSHCALTCGSCGIAPPRTCHDTIPNCERFQALDHNICTKPSLRQWAEDNCAGFCNFCNDKWTPPSCNAHLFDPNYQRTTPSMSVTGGSTIQPCADTEDCKIYKPDEACCGIYEPWARGHCASRCGYCGVRPLIGNCTDKIPNCQQYNAPDYSICTEDALRQWAEDNCSGFCNFCGDWKPPSCTAHMFEAPVLG